MKRAGAPLRADQGGFALVGAIFVMVVLATIGALAVRTNITQRATMDLQLQSLRADAAVNAGVEYAAARLLSTDKCNTLSKKLASPDGFDIDFGDCDEDTYTVNGVSGVSMFTLEVSASRGSYGSPDFVSRTIVVKITP
jgi:MSHA biogenesis protein MshP